MTSFEEFERSFAKACPGFADTRALDDLREREYAHLDHEGHVYLDCTGGGLYSSARVEAHLHMLRGQVLGNPHSTSEPSALASAQLERARGAILRFFGVDTEEYAVVLTANATGAFKIVAEGLPFGPGGRLLLTFDNHNSIVGIGEFARAAGATTASVPLTQPEMRIDEAAMLKELCANDPARPGLLAFPAQSNFSGVQHSLEWVGRARTRLDGAARCRGLRSDQHARPVGGRDRAATHRSNRLRGHS